MEKWDFCILAKYAKNVGGRRGERGKRKWN